MCHYSLSLAPSLLPHHFFKQKPVCPPSFPSVCLSPSDSYCSATCILLKSEALEIVAQLSWSVGLWEGAESGRTVISRAGGGFSAEGHKGGLRRHRAMRWSGAGHFLKFTTVFVPGHQTVRTYALLFTFICFFSSTCFIRFVSSRFPIYHFAAAASFPPSVLRHLLTLFAQSSDTSSRHT